MHCHASAASLLSSCIRLPPRGDRELCLSLSTEEEEPGVARSLRHTSRRHKTAAPAPKPPLPWLVLFLHGRCHCLSESLEASNLPLDFFFFQRLVYLLFVGLFENSPSLSSGLDYPNRLHSDYDCTGRRLTGIKIFAQCMFFFTHWTLKYFWYFLIKICSVVLQRCTSDIYHQLARQVHNGVSREWHSKSFGKTFRKFSCLKCKSCWKTKNIWCHTTTVSLRLLTVQPLVSVTVGSEWKLVVSLISFSL